MKIFSIGRILATISFFSILLIGLFSANFAIAQGNSCGQSCPSGSVCIEPPTTYCTFEALINSIINFLFIAALAVGSLMIVIAGYYFVTSMGDPQKVTTAKKIILYTLIGLGIIAFSKAIMSILQLVLGVK